MPAFHIMTDSNCLIPSALCHELGIHVVPLPYVWEGETYSDGADIPPTEFYRRLRSAGELPKTSAPTPGAFVEAIREFDGEEKPILAIFVGSVFSSTVVTARLAFEELDQHTAVVMDSRSNALGLGFQVLAAARAAREGASLQEAVQVVEAARSKSGVVFAVPNLDFLRRGGRIGLGQSLVGALLRTIPILEIDEGPISPLGRARTKPKAIAELLDHVADRLGVDRPYRLGILHSDAEAEAWELKSAAEERFHPDELIVQQLNPILAIHVGPDAFGLAYSSGL
jgi:DegV family protein with EDD domain